MASLGFDVVRLGIIWKGLEPGTAPINDPSDLHARETLGHSGAGQFDAKVFNAYVDRLEATVPSWPATGSTPCIDMHQDVYNEVFGGEGAPDWAVCTDGITPRPQHNVQNWSVNYTGPGCVPGVRPLLGQRRGREPTGDFDSVWTRVAARFRNNPWVIGYDPFNEPYGPGFHTPDNPGASTPSSNASTPGGPTPASIRMASGSRARPTIPTRD